jgi:hypothetical protein
MDPLIIFETSSKRVCFSVLEKNKLELFLIPKIFSDSKKGEKVEKFRKLRKVRKVEKT